MRSAAAVLVLLLAAAGCVTAAAPSGPVRKPLLWTMEKDGKVSYLFGTVHVGVDAHTELPAEVHEAFHASPCFIMESDEDGVRPEDVQAMAKLPPGQSLEQQVKPETWKKLTSELSGKVPPDLIAHSQPWFVAVLMMQQHAPHGEPMDQVFGAEARAAKKHVAFLETVKEALTAFASVTKAADLDDLVLNGDTADKEVAELIAAYKTGDEVAIGKVLAEISDDGPDAAAKRVLLDGRNRQWMPRLVKETAGGGCFVAVGAAHLIGPGSVRERLALLGYHIQRVPARAPQPVL